MTNSTGAGLNTGLTEQMYIDLLKKCLTGSGVAVRVGTVLPPRGTLKRAVFAGVRTLLPRRRLILAKLRPEDAGDDPDWQSPGETMMGIQRLNNLHNCIEGVLQDNVPGDFIETG